MNTVIEMLGWLGWVTVLVAVFGGAYLVWHVIEEQQEKRMSPSVKNPDNTDTNLPKCPLCGWVQGINDDCDQCQRDRKVLP